MVPEIERDRIAVLCVMTALLAGLLFPATGLGTVPDGPVLADSGQATPATGEQPPSTDRAGAPPSGSTADRPTTTDTSAPTASATATPMRTTTASDAGPSGGPVWLLGLAVWLLVATPGLFAVACEGKARSWPGFRRLPVPSVSVLDLGRSVSRASVAFLVDLSASVPRLLGHLRAVSATLAAAAGALTSALARTLGALAVSVPRAPGGLSVRPGRVFDLFGPSDRSRRGPTGSRSAATARRTDASEDVPEDPPQTVEEAWQAMVEGLSVPDREARTPAELARIAIDRGLPAEPVSALTGTFRRVTYGGVPATADRNERALAALDRIEQSRRDGE